MLTGNHSVLGGEVRRYSRAVLADRLTQAGFTVRRMTYTNASIFPVVAAVRLLQRVSGHQESENEISIPFAPINAALSAALAVEAAALRVVNMPFGSSLLALAKKSDSPTRAESLNARSAELRDRDSDSSRTLIANPRNLGRDRLRSRIHGFSD